MRLSLIADLLAEPLPVGSNLLVEYDPASPWYSASLFIASRWLMTGGKVIYVTYAQTPESIRSHLKRLGVDVDKLEEKEALWTADGYTVTLGRKSNEKYAMTSLKVHELSIEYSQTDKARDNRAFGVDLLRIVDSGSVLARFNEEKTWIEFELTRRFARTRQQNSLMIYGVMLGVHSVWAYKPLEGEADAIIDFKTDEVEGEVKDFLRIRSMRNISCDRRWHPLKVEKTLELTLEN